MKVCYRIVMKNGKEYTVQSDEVNISKFMNYIAKHDSISDFILAKPYFENGINYNVVIIRHDDISSVEYHIDL